MGNPVNDYRTKPPRIEGTTTINHDLRVKMGLGCMEYVLMDAIVWLKDRRKLVTDVSVYIRTGLVPEEQVMTLEMLVKKGFVYPNAESDGTPHLSDKWKSFFTSIEEEFTEFWTKDGKVCWPGSKPKAMELYVQARKKASKGFILEKRDAYFEYLDLVHQGGFNRPKMMATVFLGKQERYMEDWEDYVRSEKKKIKKDEETPLPVMPSTKTKEERLSKYEDPDNQG